MSYLEHSGVGHLGVTQDGDAGRSGRYEWGSGANPNQHRVYGTTAEQFLTEYDTYKSKGVSDSDIAKHYGFSSVEKLNDFRVVCQAEQKSNTMQKAKSMSEAGMSNREISVELFGDKTKESTIRTWASNGWANKASAFTDTALEMKKYGGFLDVGKGVENVLSISTKLKEQAIIVLQRLGWYKVNVQVPQMSNPNQKTTVSTMVSPDEIYTERDLTVTTYDSEGYKQTETMPTSKYVEYLQSAGITDEVQDRNGNPKLTGMVATAQAKWALENGQIKVPGINYEEGLDTGSKSIGFEKPAAISLDRVKIQFADSPTYEKDSKGNLITTYDDPDSDLYKKHPELYNDKNERGITGIDRDGLMFIRRGVQDLDLGNSTYAQVRINVDDKYYLKGMAAYGDDSMFPDGVDVIFNTNKGSEKGVGALKELITVKGDKSQIDWDNPFGSTVTAEGQSYYEDKNGKYKGSELGDKYDPDKTYSLNAVNKLREEQDWDKWSKTISTQMLSKQPIELINQQLDITYGNRVASYEEIKSLENPVIKKLLLNDAAEGFDTDAWDMKADRFVGQQTKVIIPSVTLSDDQCYCPTLKQGEKVALVRYPHAGTFEIPILTNNKRNEECKNVIGTTSTDAICINSTSAEKLSGADFDGDTVTMIPLRGNKIVATETLKDLQNFDAKKLYQLTPEQIAANPNYAGKYEFHNKPTTISARNKGIQMGVVTNLITDISLASDHLPKGVTEEQYMKDITDAVKLSQVVIDAQKHALDIVQAKEDLRFAEINERYRGSATAGARSIISKHKQDYTSEIPEIDRSRFNTGYDVDAKTGEKVYQFTNRQMRDSNTGQLMYDKDGSPKMATERTGVKKLLWEKDSTNLVYDKTNVKEMAYAEYSNKMKALANDARKEAINTKEYKRDADAAKKYANVVSEMAAEYNEVLKNKPLERSAQVLASSNYNQWKRTHTDADDEDCKKMRTILINNERRKLGKTKVVMDINDERWEAIQAHAIAPSKLKDYYSVMDKDKVYQYALPKTKSTISDATKSRVMSLANGNATLADIADTLGISISTVANILNES